jgi:hypothetical protein
LLTGQKANPFGKGFQISLTLEPDLQRKFTLRPYVTAADTLPIDRLRFGRNFQRRADTIQLNGNNVLYWFEDELNREVERKQAIFNLISRIKIHYRFGGGIEISGGFTYSGYTDVKSTNDINGLPNDFFYSTSETRFDRAGFLTGLTYHFGKNSRFQPYAGLQLDMAISFYTYRVGKNSFPGLDVELPSEVSERFRKNTIFDFDLDLLAGFNYQLNDRWAIGLEAELTRYLLPVPAALQIRYRLHKRAAE